MTKKQLLCALCLTTLISPVTAQELNIPNSFQNGQVADALDLNDNFTAVETIFNAYIFFDTANGNYAAGDGLRDSEFVFAPQPSYENPGRFNTAVGDGALESNTLGKENTAVGYHALQAAADERDEGNGSTPDASAATGNTAVGANALITAVRPFDNVAVGTGALKAATRANRTVAIGAGAMEESATSTSTVAVGTQVLAQNSSGYFNAAIGTYAMSQGECGNDNVAVGTYALNNNGNTDGTGIEGCLSDGEPGGTGGDSAVLWPYDSASRNTAVGTGAMSGNVRGYGNTAVGYYSGVAGFEDLNDDAYVTNSTALGNEARFFDSNEVQIGNREVQMVYLGKRSGDLANGGVDANLLLRGYVQASNVQVPSDERLKESIQPLDMGLGLLKDLTPVSYRYKQDDEHQDVFGFVAQELSRVLHSHGMQNNRLVRSNPGSDYLSVSYLDLIAPMIKAIQELDEAAVEKDERIATLEAQIVEQQENMLALIASQQQRLALLEARLAGESFASR